MRVFSVKGKINPKTAGHAAAVQTPRHGCQQRNRSRASRCLVPAVRNAARWRRRSAPAELGTEPVVGHVTDFAQIAANGVTTTPALVVDGKAVSYGKALKKEEAKALLRKVRKPQDA